MGLPRSRWRTRCCGRLRPLRHVMGGRTARPVQAATLPQPVEGESLPAGHGETVATMPRILIVTGEASGDLHGANLAKAIMALDPTAELVGVGGAAMRAAGVALVPGIPQLDVVGLIGISAVGAMIRRIRCIRRVPYRRRGGLVLLMA